MAGEKMNGELGHISKSSPAIINFNRSFDDFNSDTDFNDGDNYDAPVFDLDDNGFPSCQDNNEIENGVEDEDLQTKQADDDGDSFASDFYRCGTDCSVLLQNEISFSGSASVKKKKNLKQSNLFQLWGLNKPTSDTLDVNTVDTPPNKKIKVNQTRCFDSAAGSSKSKTGSRGRNWSNVPRVCPFYKKLPGTSFTVDAFRYGCIEDCAAYFLTHFHADHYGGLTKGWSHGPIYCTPITARLLRICINVNPQFIRPLELDKESVIEGIKVTMLEANHCPGAALVHFRLPNGQSYLHTGDFRASKLMQSYPLLLNERVNVLYLDTTYCHPKHTFPSKDAVLSFVVKVTKIWVNRQPKTLIIVGAYSIGKECVYLSISEALGVKIFAVASRRRILQSFGWPELSGNLCSDGKDTPLHVLPISHLRAETLEGYLKTYKDQYKAVLAFRPTGWTYSQTVGSQLDMIKPVSRGNVTIYGVPYSEHSSYPEMQEFVQFLKPDKIIPTVNVGNAANREKMQSTFKEWLKC